MDEHVDGPFDLDVGALDAVHGGMRYTDADRESTNVQDRRDDGWFTANVWRPIESFGSGVRTRMGDLWDRFTVDHEKNPPGFRPSDVEAAAERMRQDSMTQQAPTGEREQEPTSGQSTLMNDAGSQYVEPSSSFDEAGFVEQGAVDQGADVEPASSFDESGFTE